MTEEEAHKAAEVMLAYADGKQIEISICNGTWKEINNPGFDWINSKYRIKSEPTYCPFKNTEECWNEMQKHHPFGWVKMKGKSNYSCMTEVLDTNNFHFEFNNYTFADGTPFGIKKEE